MLARWSVPGLPVLVGLSVYVGWWTRLPYLGVLFGLLLLAAVLDVTLRAPAPMVQPGVDATAERATARRLARLRRKGFVLLHDRMVPATGTHVAHLAIGPGGAFAIDSRGWSGQERTAHVSGGALWLGSEPQPQVVAGVLADADQVGHALGRQLSAGAAIEVTAMLVLEGVTLAGAGRSVDGVAVLRPDQAARYLELRPRVWNAERVRQVAGAAARALPPRRAS